MRLFRGKRPREDPHHRWPETTRPPTEFAGFAPGSAEDPYEFDTVDGVRVRLHDMAFVGFEYGVRPPTLVLRFRYDDPARTPAEGVASPVAVLTFTGVLVWQWEDEHDLYELPDGDRTTVRSLDWYAPTNTFALQTMGTRLLFTADRLTVQLEGPSAE